MQIEFMGYIAALYSIKRRRYFIAARLYNAGDIFILRRVHFVVIPT